MRVAISGPNASGKTTLSQALAERFDTPVLSENVQPLFKARSQLQRLQKEGAHADALMDARKACARSFLQWMADREAHLVANTACIADRWGADILDMWLIFFGRESWADRITKRLIQSMYRQAEALDLVIIMPFAEPFIGAKNEQGMQRASQFSNRYLNSMLTRGIISSIPNLKVLRLPVKPDDRDARLNRAARAVEQLEERQ